MSDRGYILFYDSGVGGLTTLKETIKLLPNERFIYFADDSNCPYGNRSAEEIEGLVQESLKWLLKRFNIKLVVFACNTITTCCVEHLRGLYNFDIVGTEPAIIPAVRASESKEIMVLATKATFRQEKYFKLINKAGARVYSYAFENLASDIEKDCLGESEIDANGYVERIKTVLAEHSQIDGLVLGCTHYCYLRKVLEKEFKIKIYDGNKGVAKRVKSLLEEKNRCSDIDYNGKVDIILSTKDKLKLKKYEKLLEEME